MAGGLAVIYGNGGVEMCIIVLWGRGSVPRLPPGRLFVFAKEEGSAMVQYVGRNFVLLSRPYRSVQ